MATANLWFEWPVGLDDGYLANLSTVLGGNYELADQLPADWWRIQSASLHFMLDVDAVGDDTLSYAFQILNPFNDMILAAGASNGNLVLQSHSAASTAEVTYNVPFPYVNTAARRSDWANAVLRHRYNRTTNMGSDANVLRIWHARLDATYDNSKPLGSTILTPGPTAGAPYQNVDGSGYSLTIGNTYSADLDAFDAVSSTDEIEEVIIRAYVRRGNLTTDDELRFKSRVHNNPRTATLAGVNTDSTLIEDNLLALRYPTYAGTARRSADELIPPTGGSYTMMERSVPVVNRTAPIADWATAYAQNSFRTAVVGTDEAETYGYIDYYEVEVVYGSVQKVAVGGDLIDGAYVGDQPVSRLYLGNNLLLG